ncbi:MAG: hypothetical protein M3Z82_04335 [Apilactobacillus sp.]|mgnify:CR=1 FL=1|uniref:hypothetical protein n=1 Tax=Apilactobacillus apinorum TaxID=1218495 RepID=UPI0030E8B157|nr:hypothetical protein [Apilactobacillus kunkeei]MCT6858479.1 hypothetical protein [Apilactobacillus sp.]
MWNIIAILLVIFAIYQIVRNLLDGGIVRDVLNNRENVERIRQMIAENDDDNEVAEQIRDEFNIRRFYPATKILSSVKKMKH